MPARCSATKRSPTRTGKTGIAGISICARRRRRQFYSRAEYWVEHASFRTIKEEKFYSDSGRVLKILYYRGFTERLGAVRPSGAVIIDAVDASLVTTVRFDNPSFRAIPDVWYQ